ncbi:MULTISPECIES: DEAD/DEAH box helicase [unclassified Clostridioides]|uniref:DEAD/DEAH box helicase n=1 Tax=unclassified Clostridioides TaxID=2635829 RepID=UPI001D124128|nr:DEAD/DEAH box helicase [Clostridioides sp. ES-S-0171-01]MCC0689796.1 DEAD/DEAH box helicase [Clostridioides sp. ES-S-0056-01]MCC0715109.1 DEAD/DEAH box helicase [Clostridioides sp. ES-S-0077-01]UDN54242.1 DEAD/DEAH box helicase [Clostridioides sp. ES-S-0054-01]
MLERLAKDAYNSEYLWELYKKLTNLFLKSIFSGEEYEVTQKELVDSLRFSDIFSNSHEENMRNLSYRIVSLLYDRYKNNDIYITYSNAILKKLNNFPALKNTPDRELPIERELEFFINKERLKSPIENEYFLPIQYNIYKNMVNKQSLSFSGPTSMGKSFVIKQFILGEILKGTLKNFCIIVPTRALIKQYVIDLNKDLKKINGNKYKVVTNSNILEYLTPSEDKYIFVLTPERLNILLFNRNKVNIDYLIVDEAHKVFDNDTRALTYYSSIDTCMSINKNISVFFSSPLIKNPEIFKYSYKKINFKNYRTDESPVTQNLFYVDMNEKKVDVIDNLYKDIDISTVIDTGNINCLYHHIGRGYNNIIYLSSKAKSIEYAMDFYRYVCLNNIDTLSHEESKEIENACEMIKENIHKDYDLIKFLRRGIAYHFGKLPSIVRESIEDLFKRGTIKYLFCTNTLLEGVNLPAKNIFIMANYIGNSKMKGLDFWNLAGRAGRLGYEYYGNVFCINDYNRQHAWRDKGILYNKEKIEINDNLDNVLKKNKEKIEKNIQSNELSLDFSKDDNYNNYLSNIIKIDNMVDKGSAILEKAKLNNLELKHEDIDKDINYDIVNSAKSIDYKIQMSLYKEDNLKPLSSNINYKNCYETLMLMHDKYRWDIKEKRLKNKKTLAYIATLMNLWMNGMPLNIIINSSIEHKSKNNSNIEIDHNHYKRFNKDDIKHINILINSIITDLEDILRYDLEKYFNHYYSILIDKYGIDLCGSNWSLYLEFGTRDPKNIILQNAGFSRYASSLLIKDYNKYLMFKGNIFEGIKKDILSHETKNRLSLFNEIKNSSYIIV